MYPNKVNPDRKEKEVLREGKRWNKKDKTNTTEGGQNEKVIFNHLYRAVRV